MFDNIQGNDWGMIYKDSQENPLKMPQFTEKRAVHSFSNQLLSAP